VGIYTSSLPNLAFSASSVHGLLALSVCGESESESSHVMSCLCGLEFESESCGSVYEGGRGLRQASIWIISSQEEPLCKGFGLS